MKTKQVIAYFGTAASVARKIGISKAAVGNWGDHPPMGRQYQLEVMTNGALKAERPESSVA